MGFLWQRQRQLFWPSGVAIDSSGNVYVAETGNHRIQKFNSSGGYLTQWGEYRSYPVGVAVDSSGNVYVVDEDVTKNCITKFNSDCTYLTRWPYDNSDVHLYEPESIALDSSGNVYVADAGNDRIIKFNCSNDVYNLVMGNKTYASNNYKFVTYMGNKTYATNRGYAAHYQSHQFYGNGNGQFNFPRGVAVDSSGNIYVADTGNHRIQKFNSTGGYLTQWGSYGSGDGQFWEPEGVAVDSVGNVYVADEFNNRIQKFAPTVSKPTTVSKPIAVSKPTNNSTDFYLIAVLVSRPLNNWSSLCTINLFIYLC